MSFGVGGGPGGFGHPTQQYFGGGAGSCVAQHVKRHLGYAFSGQSGGHLSS